MDYLNIDDNDVEIWQKLAFAFRNIKDFENAFQAAFNALDLKKDDDWTMYIISKIYTDKEDFENAYKWICKALEIDPSYVRYVGEKGTLLYKLGYSNEAIIGLLTIRRTFANPHYCDESLANIYNELAELYKKSAYEYDSTGNAIEPGTYIPELIEQAVLYYNNSIKYYNYAIDGFKKDEKITEGYCAVVNMTKSLIEQKLKSLYETKKLAEQYGVS